jgi:hypothetical protein
VFGEGLLTEPLRERSGDRSRTGEAVELAASRIKTY